MRNNTPSDLAHDLLAILPLLNRIVAVEVRREAGEETTLPQFRVLAALANGALTLSTLAKQRRVSLQSMSDIVQTLVVRGWVSRTPDLTDRRVSLLQLTDSGRTHYERAEAQTLQRFAPLLAELSADELGAVHTALGALRRILTQEEEDGNSERPTAR